MRGRPHCASEAHPARFIVLSSKRSTEQYASAPDLACFKARTDTAEPRHPHTGNRPCPPAPTSYGQQPTTLWASSQQSRTTCNPMCGSLARAFRRRHRVASPQLEAQELGSRRTLRFASTKILVQTQWEAVRFDRVKHTAGTQVAVFSAGPQTRASDGERAPPAPSDSLALPHSEQQRTEKVGRAR